MTFQEERKKLDRELINDKITPEEYIKQHNELMKKYNVFHSGPIEPHEHI